MSWTVNSGVRKLGMLKSIKQFFRTLTAFSCWFSDDKLYTVVAFEKLYLFIYSSLRALIEIILPQYHFCFRVLIISYSLPGFCLLTQILFWGNLKNVGWFWSMFLAREMLIGCTFYIRFFPFYQKLFCILLWSMLANIYIFFQVLHWRMPPTLVTFILVENV